MCLGSIPWNAQLEMNDINKFPTTENGLFFYMFGDRALYWWISEYKTKLKANKLSKRLKKKYLCKIPMIEMKDSIKGDIGPQVTKR